jgi:hypothetical protein
MRLLLAQTIGPVQDNLCPPRFPLCRRPPPRQHLQLAALRIRDQQGADQSAMTTTINHGRHYV